MDKLTVGDLQKILEIFEELINSEKDTKRKDHLLVLANRLQTYLYMREV